MPQKTIPKGIIFRAQEKKNPERSQRKKLLHL